jgi:CBS domain-containing protein
MRSWSLSLGSIFGVEIRLHTLYLLLLAFSISYSGLTGTSVSRGVWLWMLTLFAVAVRETARAMMAAWCRLDLRSVLLLPTGALLGLAAHGDDDHAHRRHERAMALAGPIANFVVGITMALLMYAATPAINLFEKPWVTPAHLIRSAIWTQVLLGGLNLLPAYPLDGGVLLRQQFIRIRGASEGIRAMAGISQVIALLLMTVGFWMQNPWLIAMAMFLLVGAQMESQSVLREGAADAVHMRDVMLTEFSTLSASDTLEDALEKSVHSLQDVFPVVRGTMLVGAISRQSLAEALAADGNGYVQGAMAREFQVAGPNDSLVKTLRTVPGQGAQLLPVVEGERVLGIVTPQNLAQSMGLLSGTRRLMQRLTAREGDDVE